MRLMTVAALCGFATCGQKDIISSNGYFREYSIIYLYGLEVAGVSGPLWSPPIFEELLWLYLGLALELRVGLKLEIIVMVSIGFVTLGQG